MATAKFKISDLTDNITSNDLLTGPDKYDLIINDLSGSSAETKKIGLDVLKGGILNEDLAEVIKSNTTYYVATSGNDSTGDGSQSSPWATIQQAAKFLSGKIVQNGVQITVNVGPGTYTSGVSLDLDHPQGDAIQYVGATPSGTKPVGAALNGGGNRGNTGESSNNTLLTAYYRTILQFNDCNGIVVGPNATVNLKNILIRGNGSGVEARGIDLRVEKPGIFGSGGNIGISNCAIHNFAVTGLRIVNGGYANLANLSITNCAGGISNQAGALIGDLSDTSLGGGPALTISNCTNGGISGTKGGTSRIDGCYIGNVGRTGIDAREQATIRANDCTIINCGQEGVRTELSGNVLVRNSSVTGNGRTGVRAGLNSYIDFRGGTSTGNQSVSSPALNTLGNSNSFISN